DVRKEKPYQLEDRVEELFHEKSVTGAGAWNRLFDETIGSLRFTVEGKPLAIEQTLSLMQDTSERKRRAASQALAKTFRDNLRTFALITNTLAKDKEISDRWRGFKDIADSRHLANRVEPEVVEALVSAVRDAYPRLSHRYYALKAKWFGRMTLPHELGHGVHQVLAAPNGALMAPTPLTLAETASVFGEMLTFKKLLAETRDAKQRRAMLAAKVEDMINTVVRQIAFYTFERKLHAERRKGELTADGLCETWMSVQAESLGPAIELKPGYEVFWAYIPH